MLLVEKFLILNNGLIYIISLSIIYSFRTEEWKCTKLLINRKYCETYAHKARELWNKKCDNYF